MLLRDETGERTQEPTPLRLQEARRMGNVPRSGDLSAVVVLLAGLGALVLAGPRAGRLLLELTTAALKGQDVTTAAVSLASVAAAVLVALAVAAALGGLIQVGPLATLEPLRPKWSRLSPARLAGRVVSVRSAVRAGQSVVKVLAVALVAAWSLHEASERVAALGALHVAVLAVEAGGVVLSVALRLAGVLLVLALADWGYQRWQWRRDLRITPRELADDLRQMEGDPSMRLRRRQRTPGRGHVRLGDEAADCDAVVLDPAGGAAAIRADGAGGRPTVVAIVPRRQAGLLVQLAARHGRPVVERPDVVRILTSRARVGAATPAELDEPLAEILAFAAELTLHRQGRAREGAGA